MINRIRSLVTGAARGGAPARGRPRPAGRRGPASPGPRGGQGAGGLASKATRLLRRR
ncbi:MAG: hypothetical protein MSC31_14405 [Solirubrobacteraceae bacterium MAG38_C4-C5]|nr:hypothetical protein [Candidatus Siliceabacter maunaloa]